MEPPASLPGRRFGPALRTEADVRLSLPARPESVAVARHMMGAFSGGLPSPNRMVDALRLAVTEACTNVVRHAYAGAAGEMEIEVWSGAERVEVAVTDSGRGIAASDDVTGPGLGLSMIATLADDVRFDRTIHAGSRVSMVFERAPVAA